MNGISLRAIPTTQNWEAYPERDVLLSPTPVDSQSSEGCDGCDEEEKSSAKNKLMECHI